jgi:hypothetical protein
MRHLAAIRVLAFPVALLASFVALCFYVILWRRTWKHEDIVSRWLLAISSVLFLIAFAPALLFVFFIVASFFL